MRFPRVRLRTWILVLTVAFLCLLVAGAAVLVACTWLAITALGNMLAQIGLSVILMLAAMTALFLFFLHLSLTGLLGLPRLIVLALESWGFVAAVWNWLMGS